MLVAKLEPPLIAAIERAEKSVHDLSRPTVLRGLLAEAPEQRMAFFMGMSMTIRRKAVTELVEIVLKTRGHAAGRGQADL